MTSTYNRLGSGLGGFLLPYNAPMKKKLLIALTTLALAIAGMVYGAHASVRALQQHQAPTGLALNLAWWASHVPGMGWLVDTPMTALSVYRHQLRDGAEFVTLEQQQERGQRFLQRLVINPMPETTQPVSTVRATMAQLALATAVRMPQLPSDAATLAQAAERTYNASTDALLREQTAEALAMYYARIGQREQAQHWQAQALQALPAPADIKAHTLEHTARNILPVRVALAACVAGSDAGVAAATTALQHGFDIKQLRQEYESGWDKPLLQQLEGSEGGCGQLAAEYKRILTAA